MKANETVLFSDLDGTLFNSKVEVSPENRAAIERYIAEGGYFAISTGRLPSNALTYLKDLPVNGPSIVLNGGACYNFASGVFSHTHFLDRSVTDPIFKHLIASVPRLDVQICTPECIIYLTPEETAHPVMLDLHRPCRFVSWEDTEGLGFFKALLLAPAPCHQMMKKLLESLAPGRFEVLECSTGAGLIYCEVMPLGVSKGNALDLMRNDPEYAGRTFFTVGDYWNDYDLITKADVGIAVANALPEIKSIAKRVTVSNDEHAIADIIQNIIPSV
ncbi:MAG: HAD family hydrolase [Clostridia bacterium]|nr:HAD family hydrolase [Clostridia bacterium]